MCNCNAKIFAVYSNQLYILSNILDTHDAEINIIMWHSVKFDDQPITQKYYRRVQIRNLQMGGENGKFLFGNFGKDFFAI